MSNKIIWFRNDLRTNDHEALHQCSNQKQPVIGIYCFDAKLFQKHRLGFANAGNQRLNFLLASLSYLKKEMQNLGSDLLIYQEAAHEVIPRVCNALQIEEIFWQQLPGTEEEKEATLVQTEIKKLNIRAKTYWDSTLTSISQMPFSIEHLPDLFTTFKNRVEPRMAPAVPLPKPKQLIGIKHELSQQELPNFTTPPVLNNWYNLKGGEDEALLRLNAYTWENNAIQNYKETRNGLIGKDYSSKLSPYLALGCISARQVYKEVKDYEHAVISNASTYWLIYELIWRDYFKWILVKYGPKLFQPNGLQPMPWPWKNDKAKFERWRLGETGQAFIDANMRELLHTGFMSNRGRQNVASYLCKDLGINWLWGAAWFESQLIDYDASSNYGNWAYQAGVGNDARSDRKFNPVKQAENYDPKKEYVSFWLNQ